MSMKFRGTVEVAERNDGAHRAVLRVSVLDALIGDFTAKLAAL
jgi:hypothetical protein